jgi:hypothetical protein
MSWQRRRDAERRDIKIRLVVDHFVGAWDLRGPLPDPLGPAAYRLTVSTINESEEATVYVSEVVIVEAAGGGRGIRARNRPRRATRTTATSREHGPPRWAWRPGARRRLLRESDTHIWAIIQLGAATALAVAAGARSATRSGVGPLRDSRRSRATEPSNHAGWPDGRRRPSTAPSRALTGLSRGTPISGVMPVELDSYLLCRLAVCARLDRCDVDGAIGRG